MHHAYGRSKCFEQFMGYEILNAVKILALLFHFMTPCCLVSDKMFKISNKSPFSIWRQILNTFQDLFPVVRNGSHYFRNGRYVFKIFFFLPAERGYWNLWKILEKINHIILPYCILRDQITVLSIREIDCTSRTQEYFKIVKQVNQLRKLVRVL